MVGLIAQQTPVLRVGRVVVVGLQPQVAQEHLDRVVQEGLVVLLLAAVVAVLVL